MKVLALMIVSGLAIQGDALAEKPTFPSSDKARQVDPRINFMLGFALPWYSTDVTNNSISQIEDAVGSPVHYSPQSLKVTPAVACRVRVLSQLALWGQFTAPAQGDGVVGVHYLSLGVLFRVVNVPFAGVSCGAGLARQQLSYSQKYEVAVDTGTMILESIQLQTGGELAFPIDLLIDLRPDTDSRYSLALNLKRILANDVMVSSLYQTGYPVSMDAWVLSVYLNAGF